MPHVYSTLASDMRYVTYAPQAAVDPRSQSVEPAVVLSSVFIKGGTGVVGGNSGLAHDVTMPVGVVTEITKAQLEELKANALFQQHLKDKTVYVVETGGKKDPETIVEKQNLNLLDNSRQLKEGDPRLKHNSPKVKRD